MSSYNSSATVYIVNNTGGNANIHLSHQYSDDSTQQGSWLKVPPGGETPTSLVVGFNTGFLRTGLDYWWIGVEVLDGPNAGSYASAGSADAPGKECELESADNGARLTFSVDTSTLLLSLISGSCSTGMSKVSQAEAENAKQRLSTSEKSAPGTDKGDLAA